MYVFSVAYRYLRARRLTLAAVLFVACGVAGLIVVESIMGGFQRLVGEQIQGTRAHLTVHCADAESVDGLLDVVRERPEVVATAPRKRGLVLMVSHGKLVEACTLVGIDPARERDCGRLGQWMMTPYRNVVQQAQEMLEDREYTCQWELHGVVPGDRPRLLLSMRQTLPGPPEKTFREYQVFELDGTGRVAHQEISLPGLPRVPGVLAADHPDAAPWREWVAEHNRLARGLRTPPLVRRYRRDLTHNVSVRHKIVPLDPQAPFRLGGGAPRELQRHDGVLVGYRLYRKMRLRPLEEIDLLTARRDAEGELVVEARTFTVTGAIKSGFEEIDSGMAFVSLAAGRELLQPGSGDSLVVRLRAPELAGVAGAALQETLGEAAVVETWEEGYRPLLRAVALQRRVMWVVLGMLILFAATALAMILALTVVEKVHDIGTLRSIGASPAGISAIFVLGGVIAGVVGVALGVGLGVPTALSVNEISAWLTHHLGLQVFPRDVYQLDRIPVDVRPAALGWTAGVTLALCFVASLLPARLAARLSIVDALRWD